MITPSASTGSHHGTVPAAKVTGVVDALRGRIPTAAGQEQRESAEEETAGGEDGRREPAGLLGGEDEVDRCSDHRGERPGNAGGARLGAGGQVEDEHETGRAEQRTEDGELAGALAVASPQPADDGNGGGVLDQQGDADLHVRYGVEVRELRAGDGDQAVRGDEAQVGLQQRPSTA